MVRSLRSSSLPSAESSLVQDEASRLVRRHAGDAETRKPQGTGFVNPAPWPGFTKANPNAPTRRPTSGISAKVELTTQPITAGLFGASSRRRSSVEWLRVTWTRARNPLRWCCPWPYRVQSLAVFKSCGIIDPGRRFIQNGDEPRRWIRVRILGRIGLPAPGATSIARGTLAFRGA